MDQPALVGLRQDQTQAYLVQVCAQLAILSRYGSLWVLVCVTRACVCPRLRFVCTALHIVGCVTRISGTSTEVSPLQGRREERAAVSKLMDSYVYTAAKTTHHTGRKQARPKTTAVQYNTIYNGFIQRTCLMARERMYQHSSHVRAQRTASTHECVRRGSGHASSTSCALCLTSSAHLAARTSPRPRPC